jgi:hypothetical protein
MRCPNSNGGVWGLDGGKEKSDSGEGQRVISTFVFFHVGEDLSMPTKMVGSLKSVMPSAEVIQCSDEATPEVKGVNEVKRSKGDASEMMYWRTRAFAEAKITRPAMYIDTDMLFVLPVNPAALLAEREVIFCRRSFDRDAGFNGKQRDGMFKQYDGIPLGVLYPYLGCATITKNYHAWKGMAVLMGLMNRNLRSWYGDQEALKVYSQILYPEAVGEMQELDYACLPDKAPVEHVPHIMHFKGAARKQAFLNSF